MPAARIVSTAPMGSTMPDSTPPQNARPFFIPSDPQGHGDDGTLREVLDGNAKGKCQRPGGSDLSGPGKISGIDYAYCHTLRDVVQRHRQNHHGGALELAFGPFGLQTVLVQMRDKMIQQQQNRIPSQKPTAAGKNASLPRSAACSMAGISKLHTDAATMTPAAKPVRARWMPSLRDFFKRIHSLPQDLCPEKGSRSPRMRLVSCRTSLWLNITNHIKSILRSGKRSRAIPHNSKCRSRRNGAQAVRRELCGVAQGLCGTFCQKINLHKHPHFFLTRLCRCAILGFVN